MSRVLNRGRVERIILRAIEWAECTESCSWTSLCDVTHSVVNRANISTAAPLIKADLKLSDTQLGLVFSAFALPYASFDRSIHR
jgi:hypothetical protein